MEKEKKKTAAPVELGSVTWHTASDFDAALKRSKDEGKPVFLLFQEIPGCSTCTTFGSAVLSHEDLVKIIQDAFVPVAVHNNVISGSSGALIKRFGEPTWNNPVVHSLTNTGSNTIKTVILEFRGRPAGEGSESMGNPAKPDEHKHDH